MSSASINKKLERVRRPRVHISYEVNVDGALEKIELPFVVGVMADLSGQPDSPLPLVKDRKFVDISPDNFDSVLAACTPRVVTRVANKLTDEGGSLGVELNFKSMDDFEPDKVAEQVAPLKKLLEMREHLNQLLAKMPGNDKLENLLADVLSNADKAKALVDEMKTKAAELEAPKTEEE
jgi:type VI secretion system protein ImpB